MGRDRYTRRMMFENMKPENVKAVLFAGWVVAVSVATMALATSLTHWVIAAFVAIVPVTVARSLWRIPEPTMSESIHDARE